MRHPGPSSSFECKPPPETAGVGALRVLKDGTARFYTVMTVPSWQAIEQLMRQAEATGALQPATADDDCYAMLDLYDEDGSIVADFAIPTARAFRWWYRKVGWRVDEPASR